MADPEKKDPFDGEYIGNIWGWKFSLWSLVLILVIGVIIAYRHIALGVPFREGIPQERREVPRDTLDDVK